MKVLIIIVPQLNIELYGKCFKRNDKKHAQG